jgi:hypothetical protein
MRKGITAFALILMIMLILGIIFVAAQIPLIRNQLGQVSELFTTRIGGPIGGINVILPAIGIGSANLDARINLSQTLPVCPFEVLFLSANDTVLPAGTTSADLSCIWDFDLSENFDNIGGTADDIESQDCITRTSKAWSQLGTAIRLTTITPKDRDTATMTVNSTFFCSRTSIAGQIGEETIVIFDVQKSWDVKGLHIQAKSIGTARDLRIDVNDDALTEFFINGKLPAEFVASNADMNSALLAALGNCQTETCSVRIKFYLKDGVIEIDEISVPYNVIQQF